MTTKFEIGKMTGRAVCIEHIGSFNPGLRGHRIVIMAYDVSEADERDLRNKFDREFPGSAGVRRADGTVYGVVTTAETRAAALAYAGEVANALGCEVFDLDAAR